MASTKMKVSLTVVIPVLNEEKHLPLLLKDLSNQSFTHFKTIVVDAHSEDDTIKRAADFHDTLDLTILQSPKRHVSAQRNYGGYHADTPWLLFMDADDRLPTYFLQGIKYHLEVHQPDIFASYISPDSKDRKDQAITTLVNLYLDSQKNTTNRACLESMVGIKKSVFKKLKGFDENLAWGEGGDLGRRSYKAGFSFSIFRNPQYTYSLRRLRKQGTLNTARSVAQLELSRLLHVTLPNQEISKLYPMIGGSFFGTDKNQRSTLETILSDLNRISTLPQSIFSPLRKRPQLRAKFKSFLASLEQNWLK